MGKFRRDAVGLQWLALGNRGGCEKTGEMHAPLLKTVRFDTLNVRVYDEARRLSPILTRGQARDVLAAVLRHLYRAGGGQLATAEIKLAQGVLVDELQLSRRWLGVLLTRLQEAGWIVFDGAGGATTRFRAGPQLLQVESRLREERWGDTHNTKGH
jgi:hypothetical protein